MGHVSRTTTLLLHLGHFAGIKFLTTYVGIRNPTIKKLNKVISTIQEGKPSDLKYAPAIKPLRTPTVTPINQLNTISIKCRQICIVFTTLINTEVAVYKD